MSQFQKPNLLFIAPPFFDYNEIIYSELCRTYNVTKLDLFPSSFYFKLSSIFRREKLIDRQIFKYYQSIKEKLNKIRLQFEIIFVIKASQIPDYFLIWLKENYSQAYFIQYLWDDINIDFKSINTFRYFDKIFSYNPFDCEEYKLNFRPFFFKSLNRKIIPYNSRQKSLSCIWSYSNSRAQFLTNLIEINNIRLRDDIYIYLKGSPLLYMLNIKTARSIREYYHNNALSYTEMMQILHESKCQLEYPNLMQQGLTTRPFEAMATETKIITSNKNILKYDFYSPSNIMVVDRESPRIDFDWIQEPYIPLSATIIKKYTLSKFIKDLLS